jgi:hypothetical protein
VHDELMQQRPLVGVQEVVAPLHQPPQRGAARIRDGLLVERRGPAFHGGKQL